MLLDNKRDENLESRIHVYHMSHTVHESGVVDDLVVKRTQVISVPFDLNAANMYLFNQHGSNYLSLLFCNKILIDPACMYFMAKSDSSEDIGAFERSEDFPLLKYLSIKPDKTFDKLQKIHLLIAQTNVSGLRMKLQMLNIYHSSLFVSGKCFCHRKWSIWLRITCKFWIL